MSQTQKFLDNLDLIHEVLHHLGLPEVSSPQDRDRSLLRIALTCQSLCEPALDVLWRDLTSLIPLLNLLPGFTTIVEVRGHSAVDIEHYTLLGALATEDLARLRYHAARVHTLRLNNPLAHSGSGGMDLAIFTRIARVHPDPLLPHLHTLAIMASTGLSSALPSLVPATLRVVELDSNRGLREGITFLAFLSAAGHATPPVLEVLRLRGRFPGNILDVIPRFTSLRRLELYDIDKNVDQASLIAGLNAIHAGEMRTLEVLTLRNVPSTGSAGGLRTISLPALRALDISGGFHFIDAVVHHLTAPDLQSLEFTFRTGPEVELAEDDVISENEDDTLLVRWRYLTHGVADRWESTLESVTLSVLGDLDFSPLYHLNLRRFILTIENSAWSPINNYTVSVLASNWPRLEHLVLTIKESGGTVPSIDCLVDLANLCPSLRYLEISVRFPDTISWTSWMPTSSASHPLQTLVLPYPSGNLETPQIHKCAELLDTFFPELESLYGAPAQLLEIWSLVQMLQEARARQQARFV
ncbi:hypothetical protein C8R46DRAFT_1349480 [Mycena filopes]|nr:hypothetical protein C8R46DRAFT_1349480 [Mycena filopes]